MTTKTYETKRRDGTKVRVTVPESDSGRELGIAIDALRAIAGWASDAGTLRGKSPMEISAYAREALRALGEAP